LQKRFKEVFEQSQFDKLTLTALIDEQQNCKKSLVGQNKESKYHHAILKR
jgi:hypothetical protein